MAGDITKAAALPDSASKADFHNLVDNATINAGAVTTAKIAAGAVTNAKINASAAIAASKINFNGITTALTYTNNKPKRTIVLTAQGAVVPSTNGASQNQNDSGTEGQPSYYTLDYDGATPEHAYWTFVMPDSYDDDSVTVTVFYIPADGASEDDKVQFEFYALGITQAESIDASMGTATDIDDTIVASPNGKVHVTAATTVTNANFGSAGDLIVVRLDRDADDASNDTMAEDAKVLAVKIEWAKDQDTD